MKQLLYGRELLLSELPVTIQEAINNGQLKPDVTSSYAKHSGKYYCKRCQSEFTLTKSGECVCGKDCGYCRNCLKMGKVRLCSQLYSLKECNAFPNPTKNLLAWKGTLSNQQKEASDMIITTIQKNETRLLWAVTGAGKTEMLFEGIAYALKKKKRVCIASPRIDVCLELAPRIKAAFPNTDLAVLYGGMDDPYQYTPLVIATTHQLFRFKAAFDVLIIDEIDAFPYHSDKSLHFAANKAKKPESSLIYLSATPSADMQKQVKRNKLSATILPARYHGHPLPVPQFVWCTNWRKRILKAPLKTSFGRKIAEKIASKKRFLIFVPNIEWMLACEKVFQQQFPDVPFAAVSAEDPKRKEKVQGMREHQFFFLITSTILERGVTFPNIDVFVVGAEDRVFRESALVQIAGRCGRSPKFPTGEVIFYHDGKSIAMKRAAKQIKKMNQLAKSRGLIQ